MHKLKKIISMLTVFCLMSGPLMASDPKATAIKTNTSAFNGVLSSSDNDVQKALDTLDNAASGGAPTNATYITQTANGSLSNEQALGSLSTGIVKNTTTTGVLSIAAAGTDYVAPAGNVATATALAANGSNCSSGSAPLGVDASGAVESCFDVGTQTEVDLKANLASPTFTGTVTLPASTALVTPAIGAATGTSLALSGGFGQIGGSTGATLSAATGVVTLGGIGNTNNENITINLEGTANRAIINSSTGASLRSDIQFITATDIGQFFGTTSSVGKIMTTATGNDTFQLGTLVNSSTGSGFFAFMEQADMAAANRSPSSATANPTIRVYSADATSATQYVDISHNGTDAVIDAGTGDVSFVDNIKTTGTITSSRTTDAGMSVVTGANTACNTTCTSACVVGFDVGTLGVALAHIVACTDATADECLCAGSS